MNTPPPGHNANESMLSGGTEPISAVMGGGTRSKKRSSRSRPNKGGNPFSFESQEKAEKVPAVIIEEHTLSSLKVTGLPIINRPKWTTAELTKMVDAYATAQTALWNRHSISGVTTDSAVPMKKASVCTTTNYDAVSGQNGVSGSDRLAHILPKKVNKIILFPHCDGNPLTYTKCVQYIKKHEKKANTAFIFTPPFYSSVPARFTDNRTIFYHFIAMKKRMADSNLASVHILCEYTENAINAACSLTNTTTQSSVLPMLEPTYIIYPYTRLIDSHNIKGILFSAAAKDEVILPVSNNTNRAGLIDAIQKGLTGGHAWPPNTKKQDKMLDKSLIPYRRYRFFNTSEEDVLDTSQEKVTIITLDSSAATANAVEASTKSHANTSGKFRKSDVVFLTGVSYSSVPLGANRYSLRHPRTPEVQSDWENLRFTDEEAQFLNDLNLRPSILTEIYKDKDIDWKLDLASNLATIVRSKCFRDSRLVLHSDCQTSQKFISDILEYFVENDTRISALEDDDDEAEKTELRLKVDKADAARSIRSIDTTGWDKDPFMDGLLVATGQIYADPNADYDVVTNIKSQKYTRSVLLINRRTNKKTFGEFICSMDDCATLSDATAKFEKIEAKIRKEYPGYSLYP